MDGFAFIELTARQEELSSQREELEKQRKQLSKKKTSVGNTPREQLEREELLKMRTAVLKKVCTHSFTAFCEFTILGGFFSPFGIGKAGTRKKPTHS